MAGENQLIDGVVLFGAISHTSNTLLISWKIEMKKIQLTLQSNWIETIWEVGNLVLWTWFAKAENRKQKTKNLKPKTKNQKPKT